MGQVSRSRLFNRPWLILTLELIHDMEKGSRSSMDPQLEDVGARVVASDIQLPSRADQLMGLHVCVEDSFFLLQRPGDDLTIRVDNQAQSRVDPTLHIAQICLLEIHPVGDVVLVECLA